MKQDTDYNDVIVGDLICSGSDGLIGDIEY